MTNLFDTEPFLETDRRTVLRDADSIGCEKIIKPGAVASKNPFLQVSVQLAQASDRVPEGKNWLYEIKYDGYRTVAIVSDGTTRFLSRNGLDYSAKFGAVTAALSRFAAHRSFVLDGEMTVLDVEGKSDFAALQAYSRNPTNKALTYVVFDLLAYDGEDLRPLPLLERKRRLAVLLNGAPPPLMYAQHILAQPSSKTGQALFCAAAQMGLEGIVCKRIDSPYRGQRNGDWVKVKYRRSESLVVGGYTRTANKTRDFSALLLGAFDDGALVFVGRVGSGIGRNQTAALQRAFEKLQKSASPFADPPVIGSGETVVWLYPQAVVEVRFAEFSAEKALRQASFVGLRADLSADSITMDTLFSKTDLHPFETADSASDDAANKLYAKTTGNQGDKKMAENPTLKKRASKARVSKTENRKPLEKIEVNKKAKTGLNQPSALKKQEPVVCGVKITSPDKPIYTNPLLSKLDVVRYYQAVAPRMLPLMGHRILSVVRCHKGVGGDCFFKKHPLAQREGVVVVTVQNDEGLKSEYFYLQDTAGIVAQAQQGTLEFHMWASRAPKPDRPDYMVFDLDPDEGMTLERIREGVRALKSVLDEFALPSFLKTSGGKGYHVVVPFLPTADFTAFRDFAKGVAQLLSFRQPRRYTASIRKAARQDRIFIDWARNGRGATSVAPYSLRARPGAFVSMPIRWDELDTVSPQGVNLFQALERLQAPDPWQDLFSFARTLL